MTSRTVLRWLAVATVTIWLAPMAAQAQQGQAAKAQEKRREAKLKENKGKRNVTPSNLWWNDPTVVKDLGLSAEARQQFDEDLAKIKDQRSVRLEVIRNKRGYTDALEKGDWEGARAFLSDWASLEGKPIKAEGEFKLKVLESLNKKQFEKLQDYHMVIRSKWLPRKTWGTRIVVEETPPE